MMDSHKNFSEIQLPSNKKFGVFFSFIFLIASSYSYFLAAEIALYISSFFALFFFIAAIFKSDILLPLNKLWMRFGLLIGMIVSPVIIGLIFFIIFTPLALFMRVIGRDELHLNISKKPSHWINRDISPQSDSFKYQF